MTDAVDDRTLPHLIDERTRRSAQRTAIVIEEREGTVHELSYGAFDEASRRVAGGLAEMGVRRGARVLVQLPNSVEMLLTWLGLARLAAVFVPSNSANTAREIAHIVGICAPTLAVCRSESVASLNAGAPSLPLVICDGETNTISFEDLKAADPLEGEDGPRADELAELVFTSGTTSAPKAAMITHANYVFSGTQKAAAMELTPADHLLTGLPFFHVNAQSATLAALTIGASISLLEAYSAGQYISKLAGHGATVTSLVSTQVRTLLRQPPSRADSAHGADRAWYALPLGQEERCEFERRFGIRLVNGYGLTEAYVSVCQAPLTGNDRWPSVGLPLPGREVRTVDLAGRDVGPDADGEIIVRGEPGRTVMEGYWADAAATATTLRDGWLHTGDTGRLDREGYLHFAGRKSDLIKRAGENISAGEVETVLLTHPDVVEAAVVGVPDPIRDEAVKAIVVLLDGAITTVEDIAAHARQHLASFKVPTEWEICEGLPKTSIGKVRKDLLRMPLTTKSEGDR
jgi:carnitine-CoA ligase